nr:hypothetical protein [Tanacetum cinerariifolium]
MMDEELEQFARKTKNVDKNECMEDIFNDQEDLDTRIETKSDKESQDAKKDAGIVFIDNEEEEESARDEFELRMKEKGKEIKETMDTPYPHQLDPLGLILLLYFWIKRHSRN